MLAIVIVILAAAAAFGIPLVVPIHGTAYILFVSIVLLLGVAAAIIILVLHFRKKKQEAADGLEPAAGAAADLDLMLEEANRKLRASQQGPKSLDAIPLLYILGDQGSAKTTHVVYSGLDPELVAGAVSQTGEALPTAVLNLWFTRAAALVEIGASIRQTQSLLTRLVLRTRARAYQSAFGSGQAPRGAVVCLSAEHLVANDGGAALMASARATGAQLREISRALGAPLPVYVFITKLDRVPHFEAYVRNLSNVEVAQVFGLPIPRTDVNAGVYADHANRILTTALDGITYQLGEFRVEMLERENDPNAAAGVYEFPREFGKLRKNINQYLVELCKPSQLSANPYLRGFYFTGIRAQIIERAAQAPAAQQRPVADAGATQYLNLSLGRATAAQQPQQPAIVAQRVPQWTFLPRLFTEVVLGDKAALTASKQTAPARLFRRILYATAAFILAVYAILLVVSFFNNKGIEDRISTAARALPATGPGSISVPSLSDLKNLDQIRQAILQLDAYNRGESHWGYRFGLYHGEALAVRARQVYWDRFRPMLLNPTQANFLTYMRGLPAQPAATGDFSLYNAAYNPLKAYLITTTNPDKSQSKFLTPVFLQYWIGSRQVDGDSQQLAQQQIDFYANELLRQPPYAIPADTGSVRKTQLYLANFLAVTRLYQGMLGDADKTNPQGIEFNRLYPSAAPCVTDPHVVRGAFTKQGFTFMQDAILHPERYANGEKWVLGDQPNLATASAGTSADIKAHYTTDYLQEWHLFVTSARVSCNGGAKDVGDRLTQLTGPASPLLLLFSVISRNTAVADDTIKSTFQPTQALVDPNATDQFIGPNNKPYIDALVALNGAVSQIAGNPAAASDPTAFAPLQSAITNANGAVSIASQQFKVEAKYNTASTVQSLLRAPIDCAGKLVPNPKNGPNGGGQDLCSAVRGLTGKYPFTQSSATPATVADVNALFAPETGLLWSIYNAKLKTFIAPVGSGYDKSPTAPMPPSPQFIAWFNRLAHISSVLYPAGSKSPVLDFTVRIKSQSGVTGSTFVIDGKSIANGSISQTFHWDAATAQQAGVIAGSNHAEFQGTWAVFKLIHAASKITKIPTGYQLDYPLNSNNNTTFAGQSSGQSASTASVSFELSGPGADILVSDYFSGLTCPGPMLR
ncbi:MAG TPA: ImcF-related family protein [Acidobacteriaceae bacterium]|nr:ImcF-related family protein [Acidobacteriaceae bacterium]